MTTAQRLIENAYSDIGVIGRGKTLSAYLAQEGLDTLNQMMGMWSTEHFLIPARSTDEYTFLVSKNAYSIGPGGDVDVIRPEEIVDGFIRVNEIDYPLSISTMGEYNDIRFKAQGYIPTEMWYEPAYPMGSIYFDTPPAIGHILHINSYKPLIEFPVLNTDISLPAGFELVMRANLALLLAPANGKTPNQIVYKTASEGLIKLKRVRAAQRAPVSKMPNQIRGSGRYNLIGDQSR
ncbi:MAG: hypothetical protein L3J21_09900 [Devosiaceae bacterium]|nr:hypothetical protein [Devosiaceae bacterium]